VLDKAEYSAFQSTLNSPIVSYRIVSQQFFEAKNTVVVTGEAGRYDKQ